MTHYIVGIHSHNFSHNISDDTIVELYSDQRTHPVSIVARVGWLKHNGYWNAGERWNYAEGKRKEAIESGEKPQWKPVVDDTQPEQAKRPYIDDSDPNNPIFRALVGKQEYSFSIQYVPEDRQQKLASLVAQNLFETYANGKKEARAEIQAAIRNALML